MDMEIIRIMVCRDCVDYLWAHVPAGELFETEGEAESFESTLEGNWKGFDLHPAGFVEHEEFSIQHCDGCDSRLAGDRVAVDASRPLSTAEIFTRGVTA